MEKITRALLVQPMNEPKFLLSFRDYEPLAFSAKLLYFLSKGYHIDSFELIDGVLVHVKSY